MAAATLHSENVTIIEAAEDKGIHRKKGRVKTVLDQRAYTSTETDDANDAVLYGPIPSNAVITELSIKNDDLDSNCCPTLAVDIGLVYSGRGGNQKLNGNTIGTAVDTNCFATLATTLQAANTVWADVRSEADDIVDTDLEAWQVGGLSADPGGLLYINVTVTTGAATAASGDVVMKIEYI